METTNHAELLTVVEDRLAERGLVGSVHVVAELSDAERRNLILRCQLTPATGPERSIIIKQVRGDYAPADPDAWDTRRFFSDWVGAEFLSSLEGTAHAARFLAGDREHGVVALEDLGEQPNPLRALLHGSAAEATQALERLMIRLARMHGSSAAHLDRYDELMSMLQGGGKPKRLSYFGQDSAEKLCAFLREIEPLSDELAAAIHDAVTRLEASSPFHAFIHGDPCIDNAITHDGELLLIDFEMGRPGHALLDAVYVLAPFPTCTCAGLLPRELAFALLERYRQELARHIPAASDIARFNAAVLDACTGWLVYRLGWLLPQAWENNERQWATGTSRGRILTGLEQYLIVSHELGGAARLRGHAERLLTELQRRWPESAPLPLFPAFVRA